MGRGLCFMARYVPCDGVAVDGDEDDGEDGCHDAVAVVVVEDRDVAGWFRAPATEARTAISTSVLGDAQPEPSTTTCTVHIPRFASSRIQLHITNKVCSRG